MPTFEHQSYYEAWEVQNGTVYQGKRTGPLTQFGFDTFKVNDAGDCTRGYSKIVARAMFLRDYQLVSQKTKPAGPWSLPGPWSLEDEAGHLAIAADLPTYPFEPGRFLRPEGFDSSLAMKHELHISWNCCPGEAPKTSIPNATAIHQSPLD